MMNNINRMNKLRQLVHLNSQMIQECEKTIYALLIASFYFELSCILNSLLKNQIRYLKTIRCRLPNEVMMKLLERIYSSRLVFVTHSRALRCYFNKRDLYLLYQRYQKFVKFIVRNLD